MKSALRNAVVLGSLALAGCNESAESEVAPVSATRKLGDNLENQSAEVRKLVMDVIDEKEQSIRRLSGHETFSGTGICIQEQDGLTVIRNVLAGSPAHDAGLLAGDVIAEVDGKDSTDLLASQIQEMLTSKKAHSNKSVKISVLRDGQVQSFEVPVKMMRIVPHVEIIDQK